MGFDDVRVKVSDTLTIQRGVGTFASRIGPIAAPAAQCGPEASAPPGASGLKSTRWPRRFGIGGIGVRAHLL